MPRVCAWLTALGAIATAEVVSSWTGRRARIKWPNDVRVEGRKIAGILVERALAAKEVTASEGAGAVRVPREAGERVHPGEVAAASGILSEPACGAVIGIGLNANLLHEDFPPELGGLATSLQIERGGAPVDRSELARDLVLRARPLVRFEPRKRPGIAQRRMVLEQRASPPPGQGRDSL